ncbi:SDR family NAD(P)-dependent oxidoreductase [Tateyamaria omphalii]|uniref:Oxidoreductase n=1 Tax=Tateyamaria omphalii TaxID=299262 RepID=A0A1P8MZA9_9RHOB|nr:SDR family NAD(P)-dependent oxidoreductase [Tateyamaria omphalii]APX13322.1 oxidoreductase [Tateyamaria omphalii]
MTQGTALIIGAGSGLSAALARQLHGRGYDLVLGARNTDKLADLAHQTEARTVALDGSDPAAVAALFAGLDGPLRVAIYNPSARQRGPIADLEPEAVRRAVEVTAFGAFLMGQAAARVMQDQEPRAGKRGTILFTGASAGVKGFAQSAPFAMGKFAQRGLAQSMARELHPKGIHVAWVNIDGGISNTARAERTDDGTDQMLDPEAIATSYLHLIDQHRSAWSNELSLRPWVESF